MIDVILTTLLLASITGWMLTWRDLERENARLFLAATHAANERNEALTAVSYLHAINQELGRQMQAAGLGVARIDCGEPGCENCAEEWPEELEVER